MRPFSASENSKNTLRREALALRGELPVAALSQEIQQVLYAWEAFQQARQVLIYHPFRGEADLLPLVAAHPEKHWYLPIVPPHHAMEFYRYHPNKPLQPGKYGILEPIPEGKPFNGGDSGTLILVPGVLFDRQGYRLGYGKGYYDRFLSRPEMRECRRVGVVAASLVIDRLPHDDWDIPMHALATETGMLSVE